MHKDTAFSLTVPSFLERLVTTHRDFNMGDCWANDVHRLREGAEPESRNADLADTLEWLVEMHRQGAFIGYRQGTGNVSPSGIAQAIDDGWLDEKPSAHG